MKSKKDNALFDALKESLEEVLAHKHSKITLHSDLIEPQSEKKPRVPGAWTGKVAISDDFDDMPTDLIKYFN